jgi:hypothetical protein
MIMGRGSNKEADARSVLAEKSGCAPTIQPAEPGIKQPSCRVVLPKDLPTAVKYLDDQEFDRLVQAAIIEARRRRLVPFQVRPTRHNGGRANIALPAYPCYGWPCANGPESHGRRYFRPLRSVSLNVWVEQ